MDTFDWTNLSQLICPSDKKDNLIIFNISDSYCIILIISGDKNGRTSNKCLTPYHLCNLLEFKNINVRFSHWVDFVSQE